MASLSVESVLGGASFQYGLTPFETVRYYSASGATEPGYFFALEQHAKRLLRTMRALDIRPAYTEK